MDALVKNDETLTVKGHRTKDISKDETTTIGRNRKEKVTLNETIEIRSDRPASARVLQIKETGEISRLAA
jgi:hypothetical protein